ncbi:hypothetical protein [Psychromonas arctica]|uniref:hypothetical protein n=1 Tax=Psychromonas arctica TaxID=168275 RepID=UPI0004258F96|nr:hypothetical protein [Psychromonas arctica]
MFNWKYLTNKVTAAVLRYARVKSSVIVQADTAVNHKEIEVVALKKPNNVSQYTDKNAISSNQRALIQLNLCDVISPDIETANEVITAATDEFLHQANVYNASGELVLANIQYKKAIVLLQTVLSSHDVSEKYYAQLMRTIGRIRCEWELFNHNTQT